MPCAICNFATVFYYCVIGMTNYHNRPQPRQNGALRTTRNCKGDWVSCQDSKEPQWGQIKAQATGFDWSHHRLASRYIW